MASKFIYSPTTQKPLDVKKLKFEHNVGDAYECFMQTEFGGARSRDQNFKGRKWAKSLRIWVDVSR